MKILRKIIPIADVIFTVVGIILIWMGLYMIYHPVSFIVLGIILAFPSIKGKAVKK